MTTRKKTSTSAGDTEPVTARPGMPVRLLAHDWPFLHSVLPNGDLVINQRLPSPPRPKQNRKRVDADASDTTT